LTNILKSDIIPIDTKEIFVYH